MLPSVRRGACRRFRGLVDDLADAEIGRDDDGKGNDVARSDRLAAPATVARVVGVGTVTPHDPERGRRQDLVVDQFPVFHPDSSQPRAGT